jgi:NAD(P)H-dependent FMN reductase
MRARAMDGTIRVAVIYGSTRQGRFCDTVVNWVAARMWDRGGYWLDLIDPTEMTVDESGLSALAHRLEQADAFVVVTPEYNHGYPAPLKSLIDATGLAWRAKPVAFVSYGGISGGLRAVEQLRQVMVELHAMSVRHVTSFAYAQEQFDETGNPRDPRAGCSLERLISQLRWWALALRAARQRQSYEEVAA